MTAKGYAAYGLPWFDVYDDDVKGLAGSSELAAVQPVKQMDATILGNTHRQNDDSVQACPVTGLGKPVAPRHAHWVRDGEW